MRREQGCLAAIWDLDEVHVQKLHFAFSDEFLQDLQASVTAFGRNVMLLPRPLRHRDHLVESALANRLFDLVELFITDRSRIPFV
ncbi:hypothetical protein D3C87_1694820 [compost metagenome]